jgi:HAD superfamily hydrolase (TIGR01509 family)
MIKAVIFDLNGVFIQSPKLSDRFQQEFGVSPEVFLPALKEIMAVIRLPNAGDAFHYWQPYLQQWNVPLSREEFFDFWFSAEKEDSALVAFAKTLQEKGHRVFILSNNFAERAAFYAEHFPFLKEVFEKVYYSWQTGFVKPSPEAFKLLLSENNLQPEECIFFDDTEHNIKVAQDLGIESYLFDGLEHTKAVLKSADIAVD